jgi:hypothetical protein
MGRNDKQRRGFVIKFLCMTIVLALVIGMTGVAQSAPVLVSTDSGNIGEFRFTNINMSGSTATINMLVPQATSAVNTVNGVVIPAEPIKLSVPFTFTVTPIGNGDYQVNLPGNVTQTVGAVPGQQAIMGIDITHANTPVTLPNFFNVSGPVTSLIANNNPNYDFSLFSFPGSQINATFTATTFTGADSFAGLFSTVGATAVGNGSFSQIAVPEPTSVVSMATGLIGLVMSVIYRRQVVLVKA